MGGGALVCRSGPLVLAVCLFLHEVVTGTASVFPHVDARGRVSAERFVDAKSLVETCEGFPCREAMGDFREAEGKPWAQEL